MFYSHFSSNVNILAITFVNERTTWFCLQMSMLLSNKILFTECYFVTFTSFVHCDILVFYHSIVYICMYVCMCVSHMFN